MTEKILKHLLINEKYFSKVFPFLHEKYFENRYESMIFKGIKKYYDKYSFNPSDKEILTLMQKSDIEDKETLIKHFKKIMKEPDLSDNFQFLLDESEEFIKNSDLRLNIIKSIDIITKEPKKKNEIQDLIQDSLGIHFDDTIGLDFNNSEEDRYNTYINENTEGFTTSLETLNRITNGGFKRKTLSFFVGQPGLGKSLTMTHLTSDFLINGHNVLYVTLEMSEIDIAKRIDANLYNIKMNEFKDLDKGYFNSQINILKSKGMGKLIIKEYPTGGAGALHIRALLKDLAQKKNFVPDIIMVDYVGIMEQIADNMYTNIKKNSEDLRAIAVENNCHVMTASQTNRGGMDKTNLSMADLAESTGPSQIADFMAMMSKFDIGEDEIEKDSTSPFKTHQLINIIFVKNRYGGLTQNNLLVKQDFRYMRLTEYLETSYNKENSGLKKVDIGLSKDSFSSNSTSPKASKTSEDIFDF